MNEIYELGRNKSANGIIVEVVVTNGAKSELTNVAIPTAAIINRQEVYNLKTNDDAINAILKEHATRILGLGADIHEDQKIASMGGLRQDTEIVKGEPPAGIPVTAAATKTPKEELLAAATAAKTVEDLKAAIVAFASK